MLFLGESYTEGLLLPEVTDQRNKAFKDWPKIHQKIDITNYNKWKSELSDDKIALF